MQRRTGAATLGALTTALTALALLPASPATAVAPAAGQVFVNEIHYDNAGTDTGEGIEIAGPAGTDLTGWSIVLYNGSGGAAYSTRALSGALPDQQGGLGTTQVTYPVDGLQNGSPDGIALVRPDGTVAQLLSYEGTFTAVGGPANGLTSTGIGVAEGSTTPAGHSLQLTGTGTAYGDFAWAPAQASTFGQPNTGQTLGDGSPGSEPDPERDPEPDPEPEPEPCDIAVTHEIGAVQGTADRSPLTGQTVTVEGVVVGDFQNRGQLDGVFLQDADGDGDPATSDGIFVYDPDAPALEPGDLVRVTGTAAEYKASSSDRLTSTQIGRVSDIADCGDAVVPAPTQLTLPLTEEQREAHEHMLVTIDQTLVATEVYTLGRYGEITVSLDERLYQPTNDGGSDEENAAQQAANDLRRIVIDDGMGWQNLARQLFSDDDGLIRLGDQLHTVTGVLDSARDAYRIQPTDDVAFERSNPRTDSPDEVGGDLQVASFNVLNYFTTLDIGTAKTDTGDDPRGADTAEELERQQAKIVEALLALDAEVVGLMEIENDADDEALENLAAALNEAAGEERYAAIEEPDTAEAPGQPDGLFGTDAIKVAMIYQPDAVRPMGPSYTTEDDAFDNARLPLAQRFRPLGGGQPFTVVVNHFKSKSCGGATGLNADQGDGQGCWNADRVAQAEALLDFIGTLDGESFMIIGDLNSYGEEDPIDVLEAAGYVDLVDTLLPEAEQYSYVFNGQAGYLDHALVSPHLARRVTGADIWHINSDEAPVLDYNMEFEPDVFHSPDPYRSSDHDPVLVGLAGSPGRR